MVELRVGYHYVGWIGLMGEGEPKTLDVTGIRTGSTGYGIDVCRHIHIYIRNG